MLVFWLVIGPLSVLAARRRGDSAGAKGYGLLSFSMAVSLLKDIARTSGYLDASSGVDAFFSLVVIVCSVIALVFLVNSFKYKTTR